MITKTFIVQNSTGLHARPATLFVQKATAFSGSVNVLKGTKKINGKSIMGVMSLGVAKGEEITIEIDGEHEAQVLDELGDILLSVHD